MAPCRSSSSTPRRRSPRAGTSATPGLEAAVVAVTKAPARPPARAKRPFRRAWYVREYPEAAKNGRAPVEHYLEEGYLRGLRPNPLFDSRWYLERYEDVRRAGVNPLVHYLQHGFREGRDPGPDFQTEYYLEANPDVRGSGVNPLAHYLRYGRHEGRLPRRGQYFMDHTSIG